MPISRRLRWLRSQILRFGVALLVFLVCVCVAQWINGRVWELSSTEQLDVFVTYLDRVWRCVWDRLGVYDNRPRLVYPVGCAVGVSVLPGMQPTLSRVHGLCMDTTIGLPAMLIALGTYHALSRRAATRQRVRLLTRRPLLALLSAATVFLAGECYVGWTRRVMAQPLLERHADLQTATDRHLREAWEMLGMAKESEYPAHLGGTRVFGSLPNSLDTLHYGITATVRLSWVIVLTLIVYRSLAFKAVKSGACPSCAYDLTGNVSGRCPECGVPVEESELGEHARLRATS